MGECFNCKDNKILIPTTMLWHYTSISLLNEFLKPEAKLYASHFAYVNDTQDCRVATFLFRKMLEFWGNLVRTDFRVKDRGLRG